MTDLFWDEVLLTNNPDSKELEVSFKKIDGDGFLLSSGDEPGTPGGVLEGTGGEQPPTDPEGDFEPEAPPVGGEPPDNGSGAPIPGENPECGTFSCDNLEGPELVNRDGDPYSANFRVFAPTSSPIFDAGLLPIGKWEENPIPGARNLGRIATDFTQGNLTDFDNAVWSDIVLWDSSSVFPVGNPVYAGTRVVGSGGPWSACVPEEWRYGGVTPYSQANTFLVSYEDNWGSTGLPGDSNADWISTELGGGPAEIGTIGGWRVTKDINWSAYVQMDTSRRYTGINFLNVNVPFGFDADVRFGTYGWKEIKTIQMTVGGQLDRTTGEFTSYQYDISPPIVGGVSTTFDEGVVALQGKLIVFAENGYYGAIFEGTGQAFGTSFPMNTSRIYDISQFTNVFDEGRLGRPMTSGAPPIYEYHGTQGGGDYDVPYVLLYNGAGLQANSQNLLAEYAQGSQNYTPPTYCNRIP